MPIQDADSQTSSRNKPGEQEDDSQTSKSDDEGEEVAGERKGGRAAARKAGHAWAALTHQRKAPFSVKGGR